MALEMASELAVETLRMDASALHIDALKTRHLSLSLRDSHSLTFPP